MSRIIAACVVAGVAQPVEQDVDGVSGAAFGLSFRDREGLGDDGGAAREVAQLGRRKGSGSAS